MALIFTFTMFASASGFDTKPIMDINIEQAQDVSPPLNMVVNNYQEIVIVESATEIANLELRIRIQNDYNLLQSAITWQNDFRSDTSTIRLKAKKPNKQLNRNEYVSPQLHRPSYNRLE